MKTCTEPKCDKPRGGRNTRCWKHLKRLVRRNQAVRKWQAAFVVQEEDIDTTREMS